MQMEGFMKRSVQSGAGLRLKQIRQELHLTQEQLAEILDLSPRYLAQIEAGTRNMSTATLYTICEKLPVSADYLFLGRKSAENSDNIVIEMLKNLDEAYLPYAEEILKNFILAINKSKE